ncbi:MAG: urea ABC transporter permease subunit UrtB [Alphaproteobacteria bacterium]|nr:urea ABC transporter permease subunit UrtB [Alphaproteobacteria bacterium]
MQSAVKRVRVLLLSGLTLLAIAVAPLARADEFATLLSDLAGGSFADKEKAVIALGRLGDGRAVAVLTALKDGRLIKAPDGRILVSDAVRLRDPISSAAISGITADEAERIRVNNRLRGAIEGALGELTLFSSDPAARLAAAQDALRHPSADQAALLEKAIAAEQDAAIKAAMQQSLLASRLVAGSKAEKLAAVRAFGDTTDPQIKNLLDQFRAAPDTDGELRQAADAALASIQNRLRLVRLAASLFEGVSLGSVLLLAAIGLAITFGVMGVINMAHGEMIMLGAYAAYVSQQLFRAFLPPGWIDGYLLLAVPVAFIFTAAVGILLERSVIRFLYGRPLETLLATWGVSLILQQAVRSIFGSPNREVANPAWMTGGFDPIGGFTITWNRLTIIVFCLIVLGVLALILNRTSFGLHMRAVTQNRAMASVMGIRSARIDALTFGLGSGIAGMAGVGLSQIGNVSPNLGTIYIVDSFLVVVFGGVGNLMGTLVGALSLGIVNKFLEPVAGAILGKIVVLVAIILFIQRRPRGLFALRGRTAEAEA